MKTWHTKEFSKLVNVSVRTLHYYDKINLLNPSIRQENDYRLYSEKDLLRLQQIIALKYFGFELSQIKTLLEDNSGLFEQFSLQSKMLKQKSEALRHASVLLDGLVDECRPNKSIEWQQLTKIIEVFQMTQQLEHAWVKDIFDEAELKQYAEFEAKMKEGATKESQALFEKRWKELVHDVEALIETDPYSIEGIDMGERFMAWTNEIFGKEYAHLRTKKFEQGFGEGKGLDDIGLTPKSFEWISQATDAFWRHKLTTLLEKVGVVPDVEMQCLWEEVMDEMYGNEEPRKQALLEIAITDKNISEQARAWLKTLR
ncbi:MAG: MerR family transcriptional regulator [Legionellaceae bacterium]|nr:MerR family transcriptional regulator [Legionellaceae bacterium]